MQTKDEETKPVPQPLLSCMLGECDMTHKRVESIEEWFKTRIQLLGGLSSRESSKPDAEESLRLRCLNHQSEKLVFQCSCGAKHQLEYRESEEGHHLLLL